MLNIKKIPPPPDKPDPFECCGSGCVPCIFDYYEQKLGDWERIHGCRLADYVEALIAKDDEQHSQQSD